MSHTPVTKQPSADFDDVSILHATGRSSSGEVGAHHFTSMLTESPGRAAPPSPSSSHRAGPMGTIGRASPTSSLPPAAPPPVVHSTTASGFQRPCATQPFGEYVVASMFLGDRSSIAQVAACCATLYLTRSDPDLLKQLVAMFAELFPKHRRAILERITGRLERRRQRTSSFSIDVLGGAGGTQDMAAHRHPSFSTAHGGVATLGDREPPLAERDLSSQGPASVERTASYQPEVVSEMPADGNSGGSAPAAATATGSDTANKTCTTTSTSMDPTTIVSPGSSSSSRCTSPGASSLSSIDPLFRQPTINLHSDDVIEYFLAIVHRLVMQYFSYNWDQAPRVISINQEYKAFVDKELIPAVLKHQTSAVFVAGQHGSNTSATDGSMFASDLSEGDGGAAGTYRGGDGPSPGATDATITTGSLQTLPPPALPVGVPSSGSSVSGMDHNNNNNVEDGSASPTGSGAVFTPVTEETIVDWCREHGGGASPAATPGGGSGRTMLLFFHAPFSQPSCTMWGVLEALQRRWRTASIAQGTADAETTPVIGVVHGVAELELVRIFRVTWFPTLLLIPAAQGNAVADMVVKQSVLWEQELEESAAAAAAVASVEASSIGAEASGQTTDALTHRHHHHHHHLPTMEAQEAHPPTCAPCGTIAQLPQQHLPRCSSTGLPYISEPASPLYDGQLYFRFPEKGVVLEDAVHEWVAGQGTVEAKQRKFKTWITRLASLSAKMKYKPFRELQSAVIMLKRLQVGGGGGGHAHDATSGGAAAAASPTTAMTEALVLQQRHVSVEDPPLFVFLGGGMAAGKTTAATVLTRSEWWQTHKDDVVVVDADTFKAADPMRNSAANDIHAQSTKFAEQLLVAALNQGRSVIFDGTMMWQPFVEQTVEMVRCAHTHRYAMGRGFDPDNGIEEYWVQTGPREAPLEAPYRIVLLAITVEPQEAVPRGILRGITTGRSVPIKSQLRSFRLFSLGFRRYIDLCDEVTLYNNNVRVELDNGELPPAILHRESLAQEVVIDDPYTYEMFLKHEHINDNARNHEEIYVSSEHCVPMSPSSSYVFPLPKGMVA